MKVVGYKQSTTVNPITVVATKPVEEVKPIVAKSAEKQPTKSTTNKPKQSSTRKK